MVSINPTSPTTKVRKGFFIPMRVILTIGVAFLFLIFLQTRSLLQDNRMTAHNSQQAVVVTTPVLRNPRDAEQCRFYMAPSAVAPNAGLGMFAGVGLLPGDMVGFPDLCIFVSDAPKKWTHLRSHSFGWASFFGQYEGSNSRAACEGFATSFNTMPDSHVNTKLVSPVQPTHAGLTRTNQPGAGAISHHFGMHAQALDVIPAGAEFTIDYGDWDFTSADDKKKRPTHTPQYLKENGWCVDNIDIRPATDPIMGRGAFAKRTLDMGDVVAPAPLQCFKDRSVFAKTKPEQLYVNYSFQPAKSKMMFFPYGPGVNLINHSSQPNCYLRWSTHPSHHADWLDMSYDEFWEVTTPGGLILEVVASRPIRLGEELFIDYGRDWEAAWNKHVAAWSPPEDSKDYVYPQDMDETDVLRTVQEQKTNPYPKNLALMCNTPDWKRKKSNHITWYEPEDSWAENMVYCHILKREEGKGGDYVYTVSLYFHDDRHRKASLEYDESVPLEDQYIDYEVPRRAIRWIEKPYYDDEHLKNAFRHPIALPEQLTPDAWKTEL